MGPLQQISSSSHRFSKRLCLCFLLLLSLLNCAFAAVPTPIQAFLAQFDPACVIQEYAAFIGSFYDTEDFDRAKAQAIVAEFLAPFGLEEEVSYMLYAAKEEISPILALDESLPKELYDMLDARLVAVCSLVRRRQLSAVEIVPVQRYLQQDEIEGVDDPFDRDLSIGTFEGNSQVQSAVTDSVSLGKDVQQASEETKKGLEGVLEDGQDGAVVVPEELTAAEGLLRIIQGLNRANDELDGVSVFGDTDVAAEVLQDIVEDVVADSAINVVEKREVGDMLVQSEEYVFEKKPEGVNVVEASNVGEENVHEAVDAAETLSVGNKAVTEAVPPCSQKSLRRLQKGDQEQTESGISAVTSNSSSKEEEAAVAVTAVGSSVSVRGARSEAPLSAGEGDITKSTEAIKTVEMETTAEASNVQHNISSNKLSVDGMTKVFEEAEQIKTIAGVDDNSQIDERLNQSSVNDMANDDLSAMRETENIEFVIEESGHPLDVDEAVKVEEGLVEDVLDMIPDTSSSLSLLLSPDSTINGGLTGLMNVESLQNLYDTLRESGDDDIQDFLDTTFNVRLGMDLTDLGIVTREGHVRQTLPILRDCSFIHASTFDQACFIVEYARLIGLSWDTAAFDVGMARVIVQKFLSDNPMLLSNLTNLMCLTANIVLPEISGDNPGHIIDSSKITTFFGSIVSTCPKNPTATSTPTV
eukprot:GHVQ01036972.1.p1 GENE.GHVQ01036972.1~~GHVQ01036972.1.p1  ORF type:complete len:697 (+),score=141.97 GHVQ01036972.1:929-3019(+)